MAETSRAPATSPEELRKELVEVLGGLRAEWLGDRLYDLYRSPQYLPELLTNKPCFLFGGRGTGKTTVLRVLSFQGQAAQAARSGNPALQDPRAWAHHGVYWRLDTNQVTAFTGRGFDDDAWTAVFSHYVNLALCIKVAEFMRWLEGSGVSPVTIPANKWALVAESLHLPTEAVYDVTSFYDALEQAFVRFEARLNNIVDEGHGKLSMQAAPVRLLVQQLRQHSALADKPLFFLLDEYENLLDYQQRVINTFIKHSDVTYTFKIGVKVTGHRDKRTLATNEALQEPADYTSIDISERLVGLDFAGFAREICNERLSRLSDPSSDALDVVDSLPNLSEAHEAELLGVRQRVTEIRAALERQGANSADLALLDEQPPLAAYLIGYWSRTTGAHEIDLIADLKANPQTWTTRLGNYQHAMLFTLRSGQKGHRTHKHYAGWDTYVTLARGNLRFLLQLVSTAFLRHLDDGYRLGDPISFDTQTAAAVQVGHRNIEELAGLDKRGADLTKLTLGIGRIFNVLARDPAGHAPEVNQFKVSPTATGDVDPDVVYLLDSGVRNLAMVRFVSNKNPLNSAATAEWEYALHPIFVPFFGYSYRFKRKLTLTESDLIGIVQGKRAISEVLARHGRSLDDSSEQLGFFEDVFNASA
jgi:hypothetical protein